MQSADAGDEGWVLLAVAEDNATAEEWAAALADAGVDAQVRIGDAASLARGSSFWPAMNRGDGLFAYPLLVLAGRREEAARVLVDAGWDGRHGLSAGGRPSAGAGGRTPSGIALPGALLATLAGLLVALLLLLRGA